MAVVTGAAFVSLAMYPFPALRPAWERLWAAVHTLAPWTPSDLRWSGTVFDHSTDASCALLQVCGWPLATVLRDSVTVVGAFTLAHPGADGHHYASAVISSAGDGRARWTSETVAAVNSDDSLSGWISLAAASGGTWPGQVLPTGAHLESVRAVSEGRAAVASIDGTSWAHIERLYPELAGGIQVVGQGPSVPSPPLVVPAGTSPERLEQLRMALSRALSDPATGAVRSELLLDGFVALDHVDYDPILELGGLATAEDRSRRMDR
ncbi:hypothetical protein BH20ACT4_BH20ACT4_02370 [soil metagenome]